MDLASVFPCQSTWKSPFQFYECQSFFYTTEYELLQRKAEWEIKWKIIISSWKWNSTGGKNRYLSISEDQTLSHPPCRSVNFVEGNERGNLPVPTSLTLIAVIGVKWEKLLRVFQDEVKFIFQFFSWKAAVALSIFYNLLLTQRIDAIVWWWITQSMKENLFLLL